MVISSESDFIRNSNYLLSILLSLLVFSEWRSSGVVPESMSIRQLSSQHKTKPQVAYVSIGAVLYERVDNRGVKEKIKDVVPGLLGTSVSSVGISLLVKPVNRSHPQVVVCHGFEANHSH